jgi:hypothetical protein
LVLIALSTKSVRNFWRASRTIRTRQSRSTPWRCRSSWRRNSRASPCEFQLPDNTSQFWCQQRLELFAESDLSIAFQAYSTDPCESMATIK